jgi:hypothetical protein
MGEPERDDGWPHVAVSWTEFQFVAQELGVSAVGAVA